ncbi:MAG: TetR/AcrR family transcriptional regulator, partial [Natronospirillum sp.]
MTDQPDTAARILDTAEQLFAEKGFSETSLRNITTRAGVNLAAVNYHFGSKNELVQAVFERFLTPFCRKLDKELDQALADTTATQPPPLETVFAILSRVMLTGVNDASNKN